MNYTPDFDPFEDDAFPDYDKDKHTETYQPTIIKPAGLANQRVTILDITRKDTSQSDYHYFEWLLDVETENGQLHTVRMNPSKNRNARLTSLQQELPVRDMTFKPKSFVEQRSHKTIEYYELESFTHDAQVTAKTGKRKKSA